MRYFACREKKLCQPLDLVSIQEEPLVRSLELH